MNSRTAARDHTKPDGRSRMTPSGRRSMSRRSSCADNRAEWLKLLERSRSCVPYVPLLSGMRMPESSFGNPVPIEQARNEGQELARLYVPVECVALAVERYIAVCIEADQNDAKSVRNILKWCAEYQHALLAGYGEHAESERRSLEQQSEDAERRSREMAVELRDVYEKERRRLAQDLHDEVGHDLIVLKLYMEMVARDLGDGDLPKVRRKLNESITLIQHALKGVRHLTFALGTVVWNEGGFLSAMRLYVRQFAARTELKARFTSRQLKATLPPDYESALYKALQGALSNVAAHAGAREVSVALSSDADNVTMRVADDGRGFNVARKLKAPQLSFGLRAMRERIEALGGTIAFRSRPTRIGNGGSGTVVEFRLPLQPVISQ